MNLRSLVASLALCFCALAGASFGVSSPTTLTYPVNLYQTWTGYVINGNSTTGSGTILVQVSGLHLPSTSQPFNPLGGVAGEAFVPILVDQDAVTPTAVTCGIQPPSGVNVPGDGFLCNVTASFGAIHGTNSPISTNDAGLQEAANDAFLHGGGLVVVDSSSGVTNALLAAVTLYASVSIEDRRSGTIQYWTPTQSNATVLAAPATLTSGTWTQTASPAGSANWGSTTYACIAYVDVMGNEGPCSATFNITTTANNSQNIAAPAASAGAVGYTVYMSLSGGTYALAYKVPLSGFCTLTTVETVIQACAVANTTYNQTGSAFGPWTGYPVNTARIWVGTGGTSTTSDYVGNSNGRTGYAYAPSAHLGTPGVVSASLPFTGATAPATTVPAVLGTIQLPAGYMNYVGSTIRICGLVTEASAGSTSTVTEIQFLWDADGSNTTGAGVIIHGPKITATLVTANADQWAFCQDLKTTVSGAGATAGSIQAGYGYLTESYGTATSVSAAAGPTIGNAAVSSLNLAGEARIDITYVHTTGTDGAAPTLSDLTVERVN